MTEGHIKINNEELKFIKHIMLFNIDTLIKTKNI